MRTQVKDLLLVGSVLPALFQVGFAKATTKAVVTGGDNTYSYVSCWSQGKGIAPLTGAATSSPDMTPDQCATFCAGSPYFGLTAGSVCYCGSFVQAGSAAVKESTCSTPCPGNSEALCGSATTVSLYALPGNRPSDITPTVKTTAGGFSYMSCYSDFIGRRRTLGAASYSSSSMTVDSCATFCTGFTYFGVGNGRECYCGNSTFIANIIEPEADCNYNCEGNPSQMCGAAARLNLYKASNMVPSASASGIASSTSSDIVSSSTVVASSATSDVVSSTSDAAFSATSDAASTSADAASSTTDIVSSTTDVVTSVTDVVDVASSTTDIVSSTDVASSVTDLADAASSTTDVTSSTTDAASSVTDVADVTSSTTDAASSADAVSTVTDVADIASSTADAASSTTDTASSVTDVADAASSTADAASPTVDAASSVTDVADAASSTVDAASSTVDAASSVTDVADAASSVTDVADAASSTIDAASSATDAASAVTDAADTASSTVDTASTVTDAASTITDIADTASSTADAASTIMDAAPAVTDAASATDGASSATDAASPVADAASSTTDEAAAVTDAATSATDAAPAVTDAASSTADSASITDVASSTSTTEHTRPTSVPGYPDVAGYSFVSCWAEPAGARALVGAKNTSDSLTLEECATFCSSWPYFGVEYGRECYCGLLPEANSAAAPLSDCGIPCSGDSTEKCGGNVRLNLYYNPDKTGPGAPAKVGAYEYFGCATDTLPRTLDGGASTSSDSMSLDMCESFCGGLGFTFFGTEYGRECYCGNELRDESQLVDDGECNQMCDGDNSQLCGQSDRLTIYKLSA
ncbi:WSC-domain-containing protein [Thozetella sp. PMI_491]|nr:WSC-domain-containing protein [Thozetella sp. PMI_491]